MLDIQTFERSETAKEKHPISVSLSTTGASYLSKKAADLLNINELDIIAIYWNKEFTQLYFVNDGYQGATIKKNNGLWRFCDTKTVKQLFTGINLKKTKHTFKLSSKLEFINTNKALQIINP